MISETNKPGGDCAAIDLSQSNLRQPEFGTWETWETIPSVATLATRGMMSEESRHARLTVRNPSHFPPRAKLERRDCSSCDSSPRSHVKKLWYTSASKVEGMVEVVAPADAHSQSES